MAIRHPLPRTSLLSEILRRQFVASFSTIKEFDPVVAKYVIVKIKIWQFKPKLQHLSCRLLGKLAISVRTV
jgi:hypothetical protein